MGLLAGLLVLIVVGVVANLIYQSKQKKKRRERNAAPQKAEEDTRKTTETQKQAEKTAAVAEKPKRRKSSAFVPQEYIQRNKSCFIAVDTETTGLSAVDDRMIEISAVRFCNFAPDAVFTTLIKADRKISESAARVNHITEDDLKNAPSEKDAMTAFFDFVGADARDGKVCLVAHNAPFDKGFINAAIARNGLNANFRFEDTAPLSRQLLPDLGNYKLATVAEKLNIQQTQAHRAADDALVCGEIFAALLSAEEDAQTKAQAAKEPLSDFEHEVCQWIHDTLKAAGCDMEHLTFNVSTYLSVNCWHRVARLKPRAKKPYILVDSSLPLPDGVETAPATKSEGEGLKRVFFAKAEDLAVVSDWLVREYNRIAADTAEFYEKGSVYKQEIDKMKETQFVVK